MRLGLRSILLIAAIVLFVVAMLREGANASDLIALGLAVFAGAFLVGDLRLGGRRRGL
jgi:hypothetical protein